MKKSRLRTISLPVIMLAVLLSQAGCTTCRMDMEPTTCTKMMFERGYTAVQAAEQLISKSGLGDELERVVYALKDGGYGCTEIGEVPPTVFGFDAERTARVMKDSGCSSTEVGMILRDAFALDARSAALALKDLGYSERDMTRMLMAVYDSFLAIVDIAVTDKGEEWTGIAKDFCTQPYVSGLLGTRIWAADVNEGIKGTTTGIWVRYDLVEATSDRPVLTGIRATHWPDWKVNCDKHGPGWKPAGALTTGTKGGCWRNGLCVKYSPMNQAETFITAVSLSVSSEHEKRCPPCCEANLGYWLMAGDDLDIHTGCGGDWWFLCYNRAKPWPPMPTSIDLAQKEKFDLLKKYAPRVWLSETEGYLPSSVEWAFQYLKRVKQPDGNYWLVTKERICASDTLPWFGGDLSKASVYAFWVTKSTSIQGTPFKVPVVDLVYFFYYPYNRGKEVAGTTFGHHVGDWEHVTVRLMQSYDKATSQWVLQPEQIYLSAHSADTGRHQWDGFSTVPSTTHPIVYSARGSHALYPSDGEWNYLTVKVPDIDLKVIKLPTGKLGIPLEKLVDSTSEGKAWDTWERIEGFDYNNKTPLGRYFEGKGYSDNTWPVWMEGPDTKDCAVAGCNPEDPASGPIFRWGNPECNTDAGEVLNDLGIAEPMLDQGPMGPKSKTVWTSELIE